MISKFDDFIVEKAGVNNVVIFLSDMIKEILDALIKKHDNSVLEFSIYLNGKSNMIEYKDERLSLPYLLNSDYYDKVLSKLGVILNYLYKINVTYDTTLSDLGSMGYNMDKELVWASTANLTLSVPRKSVIMHEINHLYVKIKQGRHHWSKNEDEFYNQINRYNKNGIYKRFNRMVYLSTKSELTSRTIESWEELSNSIEKEIHRTQRQRGKVLKITDNYMKYLFKYHLKDTTSYRNHRELSRNIIDDIIGIEKADPKLLKNIFSGKKYKRKYIEESTKKLIAFVQGWHDANKQDVKVDSVYAHKWLREYTERFDKYAKEYKRRLYKLYDSISEKYLMDIDMLASKGKDNILKQQNDKRKRPDLYNYNNFSKQKEYA